MVRGRGHLDDAALGRVADGRVFTGRQGVALKLVDEIGDERAALAWLAKEKNIDPQTPVRDYRLRDRFGDLPFLHTAVITSLDAVGLSSFARRLEEWGAVQAGGRLNLDGLLALWPPPMANYGGALRFVRQGTAAAMIKSELVQRISSQNPHLYQRDVENIVNAILGEIVAAMARGDRVELRGFGAFSVKNRPARTGRNPRTGAHVSVDK